MSERITGSVRHNQSPGGGKDIRHGQPFTLNQTIPPTRSDVDVDVNDYSKAPGTLRPKTDSKPEPRKTKKNRPFTDYQTDYEIKTEEPVLTPTRQPEDTKTPPHKHNGY